MNEFQMCYAIGQNLDQKFYILSKYLSEAFPETKVLVGWKTD